ncbi:hypothetical protein QJS04_geneDACA000890 [Acorus gramineus]|uniref:Uncharacterized protein n=1 Tax=Acorus gramineus TaxID=55184 RepID=A0AAV9ABU5_ACOGR|nr:hypothetical protein QJS04_geneDACA000890 [Acorus gramineus]
MTMIAYKYPDIQVVVVNISVSHIKAWNSDHLPIFESTLDNVVRSCHWSQPPLQLPHRVPRRQLQHHLRLHQHPHQDPRPWCRQDRQPHLCMIVVEWSTGPRQDR